MISIFSPSFKHLKNKTMTNYHFFVSKKVTMWIKEIHAIKAENEGQAIEMMKNEFENDNENTFLEQEFEFDTITEMTPEDNIGYATKELYSDNGDAKLIADNGTRQYQFSNNSNN